ncbi:MULTISPECIES: hypothetical protein [Cellulophaga]|jgi:hypothetical protein|uniref:Uncharacterized protein n=2 Tax=Cellulophaga baltica TaxID=76594 RepID=A0A1G7ER08_9FLAO|nr:MULTISPECIES: hypothetical protein [Cellulophaga]WFO15614.1 hypothetical protein M601_017965 [Cellulophaga baltica 4]AIY12011.1 glycine dehydrogenase [Cellulophaga baltica NN016038]AIZ40380.1 glycine dehydrogenase [Cellulophaga baltica 18]KGK31357.1 glycine dehydrogenase [Cellulophaga sp. E6(2014)]MBA6314187.1 hypothetical protein [Cellulophaga baltica]
MISCDKAAVICNKAQYDEATFYEKVKLKFHILICKACSVHSKKNTMLTSLCDKAKLSNLSEKEKEEMKNKLKETVS